MQDFFIKEEELDNFQTQLIQRNINRSMVVSGCAGSGKSIIALWKAKQINDLGKTFYFVVYTKVLKKYFNDGITLIKDPSLAGMKKMLDDESKFSYYDRWRGNGVVSQVEYMIVDEAQDFDSDDIDKLKNASKTAVYFFGDSAQSLYKFNKNTISMGDISRKIGMDSPELLMHNYRLPRKVARIAEKIANIDDLEWRCVKEGEHLPEKIQCSTYDAELDKIKEIIENQKLTNVGILFSTNNKVQNAYKYLKNKGLNVEAKFDLKNNMGGNETHLDLNFASDNPKLMTYHSSKGLQFEAVFIPDPQIFEKSETPRNPLYVAMTRTSDRLYFLYSGQEPDIFDNIPVNLFNNDKDIIIQI
jgi:superfamily I DNA/RNA helicase